MSLFVVGCQW